MAEAKGSVILATLSFLEAEGGTGLRDRVLERLEPEAREAVAGAEPTESVPFDRVLDLWVAADEILGGGEDGESGNGAEDAAGDGSEDTAGWAERAGAFSIASYGQELYGGILRKSSPREFLTQPVSLYRLYYHSGDMEVVREEAGRAVLRLAGFDQPDPLFCRRQTGGLREALDLAGGERARVRHVRCVVEGDAFCEWELTWE